MLTYMSQQYKNNNITLKYVKKTTAKA